MVCLPTFPININHTYDIFAYISHKISTKVCNESLVFVIKARCLNGQLMFFRFGLELIIVCWSSFLLGRNVQFLVGRILICWTLEFRQKRLTFLTYLRFISKSSKIVLEPHTTIYKWMFGETTIFYIKIWNHPIETSICKWLFGVPGLLHLYIKGTLLLINQQ